MRHLVVMLKQPVAGRVKTRLGRDIGMTQAAWWYRHQTRALLRRLDDPRWQLWLAVTPENSTVSRMWPAHVPRVPQGRGDLGARMAGVMRKMPKGPLCIIGGDIPDISPMAITRAFRALGGHDVVFGPAMDGGFWLVGLKRVSAVPPGLFENVRWSTEHALSDSMATLDGRSVACVDRLRDVDTQEDLKALSR